MTDVLTKAQRSICMSRIRSRDTKPEIMLRKALWKRGLRYRIHHGLPGRPDIVFPSRRIAIFVDGCFWHRCPEHWHAPGSNSEFWERKIAGNQERDTWVNRQLEEAGWQVIRVWEHDIYDALQRTTDMLMATITSDDRRDGTSAEERTVRRAASDQPGGSDGDRDSSGR